MIARMWRGWVAAEKAAAYAEIVERTGLEGYRRTAGNLGAQLLARDAGDGRAELITLSWWSSLDDITAFAGDDIERARYYPEDDEYLLDREATVRHLEVASPHQLPASEADGFVITRVLPADRSRVFAHFVEPRAFSRWFVVDGFTTPAERLDLDPRPGGSFRGVMVSDHDGAEVAFGARYGALEPPGVAEFVFAEPAESVRITLHDLGDDATQLTYRNEGSPRVGRAGAIGAAEAMIDAIARSLGVDER